MDPITSPKRPGQGSSVSDYAADIEVPPEATPFATRGKGFRRFRERHRCRFCADGVDVPDYKDFARLQRMLSAQGKIYSRRRSGSCARHQRLVRAALKRARFVALLPYLA